MNDPNIDLAELTATNGHAPPEPSHQTLTDMANAERLITQHGQDLRYVYLWNRWLNYDGRWKDDDQGHPEHLAKTVIRQMLHEALEIEDEKTRVRRVKGIIESEKASRIRGMLELAHSEPGIRIKPDQLDQNTHLFNLRNGTLNLATGELRPHQRHDLITKQAPVDHDPKATAPIWCDFLQRVLPDPQLRSFMQRAAGYCMTGGNPARILLILYGTGANGKTVWLETIRTLFGDYGQQAPPETFLAKHEGIPNDIARLRGARFVAASEIGEGRRLNEPLIKRMTGGDTITARFMRSEYFEFAPQFTPWLATNHRPEIRGTDQAIWDRIRLVPFTQTIPPAERDETLTAQLRTELPGILNWAIEGCLAWQADGLDEPEIVKAATQEYREEQDTLGGFLTEHTTQNATQTARSADLYSTYQAWAKANGTETIPAQTFGRKLTERGYTRIQTRAGRSWAGLTLKTPQEDLGI